MKRADIRPTAPAPVQVAGRAGRTGRRGRGLLAAASAVLLAGGLGACSIMSPQTVLEPYAPSDGVNVDLSDDLLLRNVLVVGAEKGGPGTVSGAIVNQGDRAVTVELSAEFAENTQFDQTQTRVSVPANGSVLLGPGQRYEMTVPELPVAPGEVIQMAAATGATGAKDFAVPVLPPEGPYASLTVAPATPTGSPTTEPTDPAGGTGTGQSGDEPTSEPGESVTEEPTATP